MKKTKKHSLKHIGLSLCFSVLLTGCGFLPGPWASKYHPFLRWENFDSFEEFMKHYEHQLNYNKTNTTKRFIIDCSSITNDETINKQYSIYGVDKCCNVIKGSCENKEYHYYDNVPEFSHDGYETFYVSNSKCKWSFFLEYLRAFEYVYKEGKGYDYVITEKNINIVENPDLNNEYAEYQDLPSKWEDIFEGDGIKYGKLSVMIKNGDIPLGLFGANCQVNYGDGDRENSEEIDKTAADYTLAKAQDILDKVINSYSNLVDEIISNGGSFN